MIENIKILNITLCHISILIFIIYYILIIYILYKLNKQKFRYIILYFIIILLHFIYPYFKNDYNVHFLDVGQGDSLIITLPHNQNIMIDTGGKFNSDLSKNILIPYMMANGINKIDYLILTHGDYDHMGESSNLVNNFKVKNVIFNCGLYNDAETKLIKILQAKKIKYSSCIEELNIDKVKLTFLNTRNYDNENDNSNVIYTKLNGYKFLFMGDAGIAKEKDILNKYQLDNIDFLKVGHHGSKTSSSKNFIDYLNPNFSIISVGTNNRYGHPNQEALNNLKNTKIYRTDQHGSIRLKLKNKLSIKTCRLSS